MEAIRGRWWSVGSSLGLCHCVVSLKIKDIFKQHGDLRCYIHEVPKNNWLIFRMGEVDTQMRGFELYVSHESAHWDFNGYMVVLYRRLASFFETQIVNKVSFVPWLC